MAVDLTTRRRPAVFLDKDGTLVRDVPFNDDPDKVELMPGVGAGLRECASAGYRLFIVTNQSGIARGLMTERGLRATMARLVALLAAEGVHLDGSYICKHYPESVVPRLRAGCGCRKPMPGLVLRAAREHAIDLGRSWLVGDILDDIEAGNRAGCRTVLVPNGETEWLAGPFRTPELIVSGFADAAEAILKQLPTTASVAL